MGEPFNEAHELHAEVDNGQPQRRVLMFCRVGFGPKTEPQPQRMLQAHIRI